LKGETEAKTESQSNEEKDLHKVCDTLSEAKGQGAWKDSGGTKVGSPPSETGRGIRVKEEKADQGKTLPLMSVYEPYHLVH
jgi:hypothetical protein